MTITPDQLPSKVSNFIAYGAEERAADPTNDGEVITVRPQVYVRFYPGLVVQNLQEGGRSGDRKGLVTVHFDPASIGFKDPISAHMNDDDQTLPLLRNSLENKTPLTVAIETQRKKKNSETGSPISPLTPIHALRGASQPNGDGDGRMMMGPSGNNTSNRVAFVNGVSTQHIQSNPAEWKSLVNNKSGDLPPEGWRNLATGNDWTEIGAAVRAGSPAPSGPQSNNVPAGSFPAPSELASLIQGVVSQVIQDYAPTLANHVAQASATYTSNTPNGRPANKFDEGKQWHPRTSDGRINLGGYVVAGERWVFEWAYRYLTETLEVEASTDDAWTLSSEILAMASQVQSNAYGHGFVADRTSASHRQAEQWVQWTIKNLHAYPGLDADDETLAVWREEVTGEASSLFGQAGSRAGDYFSTVSKRDKNGAEPQAKTDDAPSGPSEKVIRAYLDVIEKGWDNIDTIRNLGRQGRDSGYLGLPVSLSSSEEGGVSISHPPAEGQESGPLGSLLIYRLDTLRGQQAPQVEQAPQGEQSAPEQSQTQAQQETEAPADQSQAQQDGQQAQAGAPQEQAAPAPQEDPHVTSIIERLKAVSDEQSLRAVWEEVKDANLTGATAFVTQGQNGEVIFGQEGQEGFQAQALGNIIGVMRRMLSAPAPQNSQQEYAPEAPDAQQTEDVPESASSGADDTPAEQGEEVAPEQDASASQPDQAPEAEVPEAAPAPDSTPATEAAEAPEVTGEASGEAQRLADAAGAATTPEEIAAIKAEMEQKGLSEAEIVAGGTDGVLGFWIKHMERRLTRAQRTKK